MFIRAISALVGVALLFGLYILFQDAGLVAFCALISFLTCLEYSFLVVTENRLQQGLFVVMAYSFYLFFSFQSQTFLSFLFCFIILSFYFIVVTKEDVRYRIKYLSHWLLGIVYAGALTGLVTFGLLKFGTNYFVALLIISFTTDTFAYLGGRQFGKRKLFPRISPNKTFEGSISGSIGGTLLGSVYFYFQTPEVPLPLIVLCCFFTSIFTQVGDLFESLMKRYSGVKDSGKVIPGHGGILDRIDGVLFAGPVLFLCFDLFLGHISTIP